MEPLFLFRSVIGSVDLGIFTNADFGENALLEVVEDAYGFQLDYQQKNTIKGRMGNVKADFIADQHPLIESLKQNEGIRMASLRDIAAMKINAINNNGTRVKDFIDIAYLSSFQTAFQILESYQLKDDKRNPLIAAKSLIYHQDIDFSEPVEILDINYAWPFVEKRLHAMLDCPDKLFEPLSFVN